MLSEAAAEKEQARLVCKLLTGDAARMRSRVGMLLVAPVVGYLCFQLEARVCPHMVTIGDFVMANVLVLATLAPFAVRCPRLLIPRLQTSGLAEHLLVTPLGSRTYVRALELHFVWWLACLVIALLTFDVGILNMPSLVPSWYRSFASKPSVLLFASSFSACCLLWLLYWSMVAGGWNRAWPFAFLVFLLYWVNHFRRTDLGLWLWIWSAFWVLFLAGFLAWAIRRDNMHVFHVAALAAGLGHTAMMHFTPMLGTLSAAKLLALAAAAAVVGSIIFRRLQRNYTEIARRRLFR